MDSTGDKFWLFGFIPIVYSDDGETWCVDIRSNKLNDLADSVAVYLLQSWRFTNQQVPLVPRSDRPAGPVSAAMAAFTVMLLSL